jgi:hypothetical protein
MTRASLHRGWLNNLDAHFAPRDEQLSSYERITLGYDRTGKQPPGCPFAVP